MRFGVSNLIFNHISADSLAEILDCCSICDFAPTAHYESWGNAPDILPKYPYQGAKTEISALQSLFYQVFEASIVRDDLSFERLVEHFQCVVDLASSSDIPFVVFGSPGVRSNRDSRISYRQILNRIYSLANYAFDRNVKLCFEVNSPKFGCEFLTTNQSLFDLHNDLDHPGLGLHLDVGQMIEEGLDAVEMANKYKHRICHLHLSSQDFTFEPSMFELYRSILQDLACKDIDIILEIQSLGEFPEGSLVDFVKDLKKA